MHTCVHAVVHSPSPDLCSLIITMNYTCTVHGIILYYILYYIYYTVHGIPQARIVEWVAFPFSSGSSQPRDRTQVSYVAGRFFYQLSHTAIPITTQQKDDLIKAVQKIRIDISPQKIWATST